MLSTSEVGPILALIAPSPFKTLETSQVSLGLYGKGFILEKPFINLGIKVGLLHHEAPKNGNVCISIDLCVFISE